MAHLSLSLLGPFQVTLAGEPVTSFESNKVRALLAYLALEAERSHRREVLAALFWPDWPDRAARSNLRNSLAKLRKAVGDHHARPPFLLITRDTIQFNTASDYWLDVTAFRALVEADQPKQSAARQLEEAVALYRGSFLEGFSLKDSVVFDDWSLLMRERLQRQALMALYRLAGHYEKRGEYERACDYARRQVELEPWQEEAHQQLMRLLALSDRRSAALAQYEICRRRLDEELGVEPAKETTRLYELIRDGKLLRAPSPARPPDLAVKPPAILDKKDPVQVERPVFVAREPELAQLSRHLDAALAGRGQVVLVTGEAGSGKTTLLHEFARRAQGASTDLVVAGGNCNAHTGPGDPYLPFRQILGLLTGDVETGWVRGLIARENARRLWTLLPVSVQALLDLGGDLVDTLIPGAALATRVAALAPDQAGWLARLERRAARDGLPGATQSALFEQVANVLKALAEQRPLLLVLDDAQWADLASINLLFHLGRRLAGSRILMVVAYRPEDVALGRDGERHPLESVVNELKRAFGEMQVDLGQAGGRHFVDAFLDTQPNQLGPDFRAALYGQTRGHPLFTIELLRNMQERGDILRDEQGQWIEGAALSWGTLPARVEAVIEERVGRLEERLRDILAVASVEGERFTAQVVARVQAVGEREMLGVLSQELETRHRLVLESGEVQVNHHFLSRYQFAHALFQQYLYHTLSAGERRLLHGEVAAALEEVHQDQTQQIAAQLAHHYAEARQGAKAVEYLLCAGQQARLAYANEEATTHFCRALALLGEPPLDGTRNDWRLEALKGLGQIYFAVGNFDKAEEHLREAIALGQGMGLASRELVRLYHWLGEVLHWQKRYDDHIRVGEEGLALLGDDVESVEAALMNHAVAMGHWGKGNEPRTQEFTRRTARFIRRLPYSPELGPAYVYIIAGAYKDDKDTEEAMRWLQALEERATLHHDLRALGEVHRYTAELLAKKGDLHGAISRYEHAVELFTRAGDTNLKNHCQSEMVDVLLSLGEPQKAGAYACRLLETAKAIGYTSGIAGSCWLMGRIFLCQGVGEKAMNAFQETLQLSQGIQDRWLEPWSTYALGRAHLAQDDRMEALRQFQEAAALLGQKGVYPLRSPGVLSGLEEAYEEPEAFRAFCRRFRQEHPHISELPLAQWFLEPASTRATRTLLLQDDFITPLSPDWTWQDPFGDCSFTVQSGLEIHAANGRDLWHINLSAPRLLRPIAGAGDLAVQTVCTPFWGNRSGPQQKPASGGLLLWQDRKNWLRLDKGTWGEHEITFMGCLENQDVLIGRGRLSWKGKPLDASGRVFLRLERIGGRVNAFCSADGKSWFVVGNVAFPVEKPVQVGLHAIGSIDRTIYHGAHPDGTAIRFESFQLWEI
jgi:DNA-binding SARP family transcriptional activator/energy-coupling factor transporter ATP-binding protein EcfA2